MSNNKQIFLSKLGKKIAFLREAKGMSQSELSLKCDKDRQSINRLERGNINPSIYYLYEISSALEVPLSKLLDFNPDS